MQSPRCLFFLFFISFVGATGQGDEPIYRDEMIFPLHPKHNHAPGIVEYPNGDLLVSWYRGSGERSADDVAVYGSRLKQGESTWSEAELLVDTPNFPDCNTAMMIDREKRLWLVWPVVIANTWETCLTQVLLSSDYEGPGMPKWDERSSVFLSPPNFKERMLARLEERLAESEKPSEHETLFANHVRKTLEDKVTHRLGWQPRCKPVELASGRILLPLYTDTYSVSLMAISDDHGKTWYASEPLAGFGNIQPAVLQRHDGTLVAYMRENGPLNKIRVCESPDEGLTWGPVGTIDLPNPGSGLDAVRLANGHWLLIYNDTVEGRSSLAVSISDDEGKTWRWTRHLEQQEAGSYHYPAVIQGADGMIHFVYSYFAGKDAGKTMKHVAANEAWVQAGD
ncbi:MAG: exo-alpha-sialidase [Pirellulales bacterium]|nr:exo-alpha-sialidase [Pirellulales bacterium]